MHLPTGGFIREIRQSLTCVGLVYMYWPLKNTELSEDAEYRIWNTDTANNDATQLLNSTQVSVVILENTASEIE